MSNFICSECGKNIIDCGHNNLKTDREIELEEKLDIAIKALDCIEREDYMGLWGNIAEEALEKIKEIK